MICEPTIEEAVLSLVKRRTAGLTTAEDRVYLSDQVPQTDARPWITVETLTDVPVQCSEGDCGLSHATFAVKAHAVRQGEAVRIARILEKRLNRIRGLYGGVQIQGVLRINRFNPPGTAPDGREYGPARSQLDIEVWFEERLAAL